MEAFAEHPQVRQADGQACPRLLLLQSGGAPSAALPLPRRTLLAAPCRSSWPGQCAWPSAWPPVQVCKLVDYGVDAHHIFIVMPQYPCSLREWRLQRAGPPAGSLQTCLAVFADIVEAVQACPRAQCPVMRVPPCLPRSTPAAWAEGRHGSQTKCGPEHALA